MHKRTPRNEWSSLPPPWRDGLLAQAIGAAVVHEASHHAAPKGSLEDVQALGVGATTSPTLRETFSELCLTVTDIVYDCVPQHTSTDELPLHVGKRLKFIKSFRD